MNINPLPPDLIDLEERLRNRPSAEPSFDLCERVIFAARQVCETRRKSWWRGSDLLSAAAAVVLVFLNLSTVVASQKSFTLRVERNGNQVVSEFQSLRAAEAQLERTFK